MHWTVRQVHAMKFFRYRRPSLKSFSGITRGQQEVKEYEEELGVTAFMKPFRWWTNTKRKIKRETGYESDTGG